MAKSTRKKAGQPKPVRKKPEKPSLQRKDLRSELIRHALAILEEEGPQTLTLRLLAQRAKVSPMAPYRHFDSKESILAAVAEEGFLSLSEEIRRACAGAAGGGERLEKTCLAYVHYGIAHPAHFGMMFGSAISDRTRFPGLAAAADGAFSLLMDAIAACQDSGEIRGEHPAVFYAAAVWSMIHGLASLFIHGQMGKNLPAGMTPETVARHLLRLLMDGIAGADRALA